MFQAMALQKFDLLGRRYDRSHVRWLRHEGGEAQCAFEGAVTALLRPGLTMLDAACCPGAIARRLARASADEIDLTMLDASRSMLARCADIPARRVHGRLQALPFCNGAFDLTTCAWGVEATDDPKASLAELARVTRPGGRLCLVFCAERPSRTFLGRGLRYHITASGLGRFLKLEEVVKTLETCGIGAIQHLHCTGPAAALVAHVKPMVNR